MGCAKRLLRTRTEHVALYCLSSTSASGEGSGEGSREGSQDNDATEKCYVHNMCSPSPKLEPECLVSCCVMS